MKAARVVMGALAAGFAAMTLAPQAALAGPCVLQTFTLPVTMEGARASVPVKVNGQDTRFWLDSGAWFSIMPQAKAEELGLKLAPAPMGLTMRGIGGSFVPQVTRIKDFAVVGAELHNVDFLVGGSDSGNGLIGRNLLTQADTEFDLAHGTVRMVSPKDCGKTPMAYWAVGKPYFTVKLISEEGAGKIHDLKMPVLLNGVEVDAAIDTGATTLISRRAAERAGLDLKGPGAEPISGIGGFGRRFENGWLVRVEKVGIGDETILHPRLVVIDGPITAGDNSPDMLIGVDFLLAHHLYVSRQQRLIYFTYSGGEPFPFHRGAAAQDVAADVPPQAVPDGMHVVKAVDGASEPVTADDFARRAAARLARRDAVGAVADYSAAIGLAPDNASYYRERAKAYGLAGNGAAARADFDKAIGLAPDDPDMLLARARMRHAEKDDIGAFADAQAAQKQLPPTSLKIGSVAGLYDELGKAALAVHLYDPMIAAHPDDVRLGGLLNGRCWSRALAGIELDGALADCNKALKLTHGANGVLDSHALVLFRKGDFAGALADYDKVLASAADSSWSQYMRGLTRIALGDVAAGTAERDAALKVDPQIATRAAYYGIGN